MKSPVRVAVTGAAGQISYSLIFRIAAGEMLGPDQPVILQLLEITPALEALKGAVMEIEDCAFPLVQSITQSDDPKVAFKDADYCLLVGARPRGPGMERKDLLEANAQIFSAQGAAIGEVASENVKVLVVGNPANTNALIAYRNAPGLKPGQFTAMTRLDHNRAIAQLASKTGKHSTDVKGMIIWEIILRHSTPISTTAQLTESALWIWSILNGSLRILFPPSNNAVLPLSRLADYQVLPLQLMPLLSICETGPLVQMAK